MPWVRDDVYRDDAGNNDKLKLVKDDDGILISIKEGFDVQSEMFLNAKTIRQLAENLKAIADEIEGRNPDNSGEAPC